MPFNRISIIIPCLNPDEKMINLIRNLRLKQFEHIVVINDGSSAQYDSFFKEAEEDLNCHVLRHHVNLGKGRALKTAFNYVLNTFPDHIGAVTVDADGQHSPEDILKCSQALLECPQQLIMGCRDFSAENIPFRSRFGNILTRNVFKFLCGVTVSDTQTGLRAISYDYLKKLMNVSGERFEFEMNMLIDSKQNQVMIQEVPIQTIYLEDNKSSHFNPLVDSLKIYSVFLKFIFSSLSSFLIDISLFTLLMNLLKDSNTAQYILIATILARVVSSVANFMINKNTVFNLKENAVSVAIKYYILCAIQMLISGIGVSYLYQFIGLNEVTLKLIVDVILFLLSFQIQREWVFKREQEGVSKTACI